MFAVIVLTVATHRRLQEVCKIKREIYRPLNNYFEPPAVYIEVEELLQKLAGAI
jgi:hypothetical protein